MATTELNGLLIDLRTEKPIRTPEIAEHDKSNIYIYKMINGKGRKTGPGKRFAVLFA